MEGLLPYMSLTHVDISSVPGGPSPRAAHTCDVVGNFLVIFGGWTGKEAMGDAYAYHVKKKRWYTLNLCIDMSNVASNKKYSKSQPPLLRNNHASSVFSGELYIHGGHDGNNWLSDMISIDLSSLEESASGLTHGKLVDVPVRVVEAVGKLPSKRACHSMTRAGDCFYMFGGYDGTQCFNDLLMFDPSISNWTRLSKPHGTKPAARNAHTLVSDGYILYLSGGHSGSTHFNDVHTYTISSHTWSKVKLGDFVPPAVRGHAATFYQDEMYVFGGFNGEESFNTLYVYNLRSCSWRKQFVAYDSNFISKRQRCSLNTLEDVLYIFGGFNGQHWLNDLHVIKRETLRNVASDESLITFARNMGKFMNNPLFSDVSISTAGKEIPAHRVILASNSEYFNEILSQSDPPKVIELCGWSLDSVMKVLEFIYTYKIDDFENNTHYRICEVMGLSENCKLESLKVICENTLVEKLDVDNACYLLKYSKLYNANNLCKHCFDFIAEHAADVMLTPGFDELSSAPSLVLELAKLSINKNN